MSFLKCHLDNYPPHEGALRLNWPRAGHLDFEEIRKRPEQTSRQLRPPTADENNISGDSFPNSWVIVILPLKSKTHFWDILYEYHTKLLWLDITGLTTQAITDLSKIMRRRRMLTIDVIVGLMKCIMIVLTYTWSWKINQEKTIIHDSTTIIIIGAK